MKQISGRAKKLIENLLGWSTAPHEGEWEYDELGRCIGGFAYADMAQSELEDYIADLEAENEKLLQQQAHAEMEWSTALNILDVDGEHKDSAKDGDLIRLAQKRMNEYKLLLQRIDLLKKEVNKLRNDNAYMRERLAGFDPKEVMPSEGVDVLAFTQHDDYQLLNWNGVCYCEAYGSDNATEPAGFYDEEIIRWWRLPDRPQSGGEQESEQ